MDAVIAIVGIVAKIIFVGLEDAKRRLMHYWQLFGRSLTLRSQSPSARKLASVIATAFVEICSK